MMTDFDHGYYWKKKKNSQLGEFFKTTVDVCQGCLLSPTLSNLFLENIMQETLHEHHKSVSMGVGTKRNLRFVDNFNLTGIS